MNLWPPVVFGRKYKLQLKIAHSSDTSKLTSFYQSHDIIIICQSKTFGIPHINSPIWSSHFPMKLNFSVLYTNVCDLFKTPWKFIDCRKKHIYIYICIYISLQNHLLYSKLAPRVVTIKLAFSERVELDCRHFISKSWQ